MPDSMISPHRRDAKRPLGRPLEAVAKAECLVLGRRAAGRLRLPAVVAAAAWSVGAIGCDAVLGIDPSNLTVQTNSAGGVGGQGGAATGGGGTGGTAGSISGGTSGTGGTSGMAGTSDTGGASGTAGASGTGGAAGTSAVCETGEGGIDVSGMTFDPPWDCVGQVTQGTATTTTIDITLTMIDFGSSTNQPVGGMLVQVCSITDPSCSSPMGSSTSDPQSGNATVTVSTGAGMTGFTGFLTVTDGPDAMSAGRDDVNFLYFFPQPLVADFSHAFLVLPNAVLMGFEGVLQATADPTKGNITVNVVDCTQTPAAGVVLGVDACNDNLVPFYFFPNGGTELPGASPGTTSQTDISGFGGFLNVPAGFKTVEILPNVVGGEVGKIGVYTRAGWFTTMVLGPTPLSSN